MIKNAILSLKKSFGKTILLFVLMCIIANLVIAGLSIKSATVKSMDQVRLSLGSDVTFSYNMMSFMQDRDKGQAMSEVIQSITIDMADQLKDLDYVDSYNYTVSANVSSDDIDPVSMQAQAETSTDTGSMRPDMGGESSQSDQRVMMDNYDFSIVGNTTMAYLSDFTSENYVLTAGRLLSRDDIDSQYCVIETNLASDNDLEVGDTFSVTTTDEDDNEVVVELEIVGIYEIQTSSSMGNMMSNRQNPYNQIYTGLGVAQQLSGSDSDITSATYYLDDPDHIEAFKELATTSTDIDFETYTLDANDSIYQSSISSLENMENFASIFLGVVIVAGSAILCLILILTLRSRFYELGVFLSLGQSKIKIVLQQLVEVGIIAVLAFGLSLGTGKMVSNVVSGILEDSTSSQGGVMMEMPSDVSDMSSFKGQGNKGNMFNQAMSAPTDASLDVSMTTETVIQLAEITGLICLVSVLIPSIYILRLSPREILVKKEG